VIPAATETNIHTGWTVGAGADYAFTNHWIGRFEMRYTDFSDKSYETYDGTVNVNWNQIVGTIGLSYKF
jgi:outer membrane immunogenic protein